MSCLLSRVLAAGEGVGGIDSLLTFACLSFIFMLENREQQCVNPK